MTTDTANFDFQRDFQLNTDQLWHLLTDARMREVWGAPELGMILKVTKEDLRIGGLERHICGEEKAPDFEVETRWYHLNAPKDAVFTETVMAEENTFATSLVTYRVAEKGAGSALFINVAVSSFSGAESLNEFKAGWGSGLDNLDRVAAEMVNA